MSSQCWRELLLSSLLKSEPLNDATKTVHHLLSVILLHSSPHCLHYRLPLFNELDLSQLAWGLSHLLPTQEASEILRLIGIELSQGGRIEQCSPQVLSNIVASMGLVGWSPEQSIIDSCRVQKTRRSNIFKSERFKCVGKHQYIFEMEVS